MRCLREGSSASTTAQVDVGEDLCLQYPGARPGPHVVLSVIDTGVGMDDDTRAHVFEPFFTTKATGTGLGLATVYGAVVQNGGFVTVSSEAGKGTTFTVYLPAVPEQAAAEERPDRAVPGPAAGTILLVEDEPLVRELAHRTLANAGYVVLPCGSGADALRLAATHGGDISLLLTDVVMPGMNGRELAAHIATARPNTRVLFTSGYSDDIIASHGLLHAGLEFLGKPYTPQALTDKVRAVLGRP